MTWDKITWAVASVAWWFCLAEWFEYFWISCEVYTIFFALLLVDFLFWVCNAYLKDKKSVTSEKMVRWLFKKLVRLLLPLIVVLVLKWVWAWDLEFATNVIISILILSEWYSIIWHIYWINSWKELPEIDAFEMLINFIAWLFKAKMPKEAKKSESEKV